MTTPPENREEELLRPLLRRLELAEDTLPLKEHPDEETLALLTAGGLLPEEHEALLSHLEACPPCRELVSEVLKSAVEPAEVSVIDRQPRRIQTRLVVLALAASLLVAIGLVLWGPGRGNGLAERELYEQTRQLLAQGDFPTAREKLERAAAEGIESDRLRTLQVQALLELPGEVAFDSQGRLPQFGYGIGGVVARSSADGPQRASLQQALAILELAEEETPEMFLNRGYVLLALNRTEEAQAVFETLTRKEKKLPGGWLGLGLAQFASQNFAGAEASFRQCLEMEPGQIAAQLNLAMTLEEQGKLKEALATWRGLPQSSLTSSEQEQVQQEIEELERHLER